MISEKQITSAICQGINKLAGTWYKIEPQRIELLLRLKNDKVDFISLVDQKPAHSVQLKDLIGNNFYNGMIKSHLTKILKRLGDTDKISDQSVNLLIAVTEKQEVKMILRNNDITIRQITDPSELK